MALHGLVMDALRTDKGQQSEYQNKTHTYQLSVSVNNYICMDDIGYGQQIGRFGLVVFVQNLKIYLSVAQMSLQENAKVLVRVRPLLHFEDEPAWLGTQQTIQCMDTKAVRARLNKGMNSPQINFTNFLFKFEKVMQSPLTSEKIYKSEIKNIIQRSIVDSINSTIVAYGQTCSGKTYTLLGVKQAPGFIPCAFRDIFAILKNHSIKEKYMNCTIKLSYIELYNQKLVDLLNPKQNQLKIINDSCWGSEVEGSVKVSVNSFQECLQFLDEGEQNRKYATKNNHERSSRSHTILKIYIQKRDLNLGFHRSVINIVDLAGSQRLTETSTNTKQTAHINKSLFQFSNVISKLSENSLQYIPYRDSKLTRLLESSLTKNSMITVMFCISPAVLNLNQSISTLRLASKAKSIKCEIEDEYQLMLSPAQIKQLYGKLAHKDKKIKELQKKVEQLTAKIKKLQDENKSLEKQKKMHEEHKEVPSASLKLICLVDHENFLLLSQNEQITSESEQFEQIKKKFIDQMSIIYEEYASDILEMKQFDRNLLKIQEICFLSMCYSRETLHNHRAALLSEMEATIMPQEKGTSYNDAINRYKQLLAQQKPEQSLNYPDSPIFEQSTIEITNQLNGSNLYNWGCVKDSRVLKSKSPKQDCFGIHKINEQFDGITSLCCGTNHTLVVSTQGRVFGWGKNSHGQICKKTNKNDNVGFFREISFQKLVIKEVAAGWGHSLALTCQGNVYSWGYGQDGQLGHGNQLTLSTPQQIKFSTPITKIFAGHSHSAFIDLQQHCYAFGFNKDYRLMVSQSKQVLSPTKIPISGVIKASLGVNHSCVLTKNGKVFCGGIGSNGELGVQLNPTISGFEIIAGPRNNFEQQPQEKICPIVQVEYFSDIKVIDIACGQNFTAVINKHGQLYTFGKSSYERLGHQQNQIKKIVENVNRVSVGYRHGFAWNTQSKNVFGWGFNMHNQLGILQAKDLKKPEVIDSLSGKTIIDIKAGFFHSVAFGK